jgi:hypothetical protein
MRPALPLFVLLGLSLVNSLGSLSANASEWPFTAYLDGKEIGQHRFAITESDDAIMLTSEADFQVKILFINAYQYQHRASEVWQNDCLQKLDARTEENRDVSLVVGRQQDGSFKVEGPKGPLALPDCAMTFAYWNPKMLQQDKLLNPQTGEWLDVDIRRIGRETIEVRGQPVTAERYRLTASKMKIDLWYSEKQEWLALESTTPEGYLISYKLR